MTHTNDASTEDAETAGLLRPTGQPIYQLGELKASETT